MWRRVWWKNSSYEQTYTHARRSGETRQFTWISSVRKGSSCYFKRLYLLINLHYAAVRQNVKSAHCRLHSAPHNAFNRDGTYAAMSNSLDYRGNTVNIITRNAPLKFLFTRKHWGLNRPHYPLYSRAVSVCCIPPNIKCSALCPHSVILMININYLYVHSLILHCAPKTHNRIGLTSGQKTERF
jgi:hypothetical protein